MASNKKSESHGKQQHKKKKKKQRKGLIAVLIVIIIIAAAAAVLLFLRSGRLNNILGIKETAAEDMPVVSEMSGEIPEEELSAEEEEDEDSLDLKGSDKTYSFETTDDTVEIDSDQVKSDYAILVNVDDGTVVAERRGTEKTYPASMTKILTVLVAAEHLDSEDSLDDVIEMDQDIADYIYVNDCSIAGFSLDEPVTVRDAFYGTILPSGADAALMLSHYIAGSQADFVDLMNEKLDELGISDTTHFTNCIGLFNEEHYCTMEDMAIILNAAMDNEWCREVLSTHQYTTEATDVHPDGLSLSNLFLRRIEDKETYGEVIGAKTGFVNESGCCAASYFTSDDGTNYICVTGNTTSSWKCIYDHVAIYNIYVAGNTSYDRYADGAPEDEVAASTDDSSDDSTSDDAE